MAKISVLGAGSGTFALNMIRDFCLTSTAWYDIRHDRYWTELLEKLDLDVEKLPEILDCGLLGLMTDGYEPNFPGITARQEAYVQEIVAQMSDVAEIYFPGAAVNRADIEAKVKKMNEMELDGKEEIAAFEAMLNAL